MSFSASSASASASACAAGARAASAAAAGASASVCGGAGQPSPAEVLAYASEGKAVRWLRSVMNPLVDHYAVQIGEGDGLILEVTSSDGRPKSDARAVMRLRAPEDREWFDAGKAVVVGVCRRTTAQLDAFRLAWVCKHPRYVWDAVNCQAFAKAAIAYATDNEFHGVPMAQSATCAVASGPTAFSIAGKHAAHVGAAEAQYSIFGAKAMGPNALADATPTAGPGFVDAGLGEAGIKASFAEASVCVQLRTGFGAQDGTFEASVAGFGCSVGKKIGIATPFFKLAVKIPSFW